MSTTPRYDDEFKKSIVTLHQNGKSQSELSREYGISFWVSDITYIKAGGKFCYICVIIDLFARKVIAYKASL